jgi:P2-related tail formation protein
MEGWKMIELQQGELHGLLPPNFKEDKEVRAVCYALDRLLLEFYDRVRLTYTWAAVRMAGHELLDYLAAELRTPFYSASLDLDLKRSMVANTFIWYSKLGTKEVIEEVVTAVFGTADVDEWFEYGGDPYFFRIRTEGRIRSQEEYSDFLRLLYFLKNTRSWLEKITLLREAERRMYVGHGVRQYRWERPLLQGPQGGEYPGRLYVGHGVRQYRWARPWLTAYRSPDYQGTLRVGHGARQYRYDRPRARWFEGLPAVRAPTCLKMIYWTKFTYLRMDTAENPADF